MATLNIAYTSSDKYVASVNEANSRVQSMTPMAQLFSQRKGNLRDTQVRIYADDMIGSWDAYSGSGSLSARVYGAGPVVTNDPAGYGGSLTILRGDYDRDPGLIQKKLNQVVTAAVRMVDIVGFAALANAFSTTYSDGTGTPYLINASGGTLHSGKGAAFTQSNNVAAALSETSLASARVILTRWKNWGDGALMGLGQGAKALIVPPEVGNIARKLVESQSLPFSNSGSVGDVSNVEGTRGYVVLENPFLTNTSRWFLVDVDNTPVAWNVFLEPRVTIRDADNHSVIIEWSGEWGAAISGPPDGLVGSSA